MHKDEGEWRHAPGSDKWSYFYRENKIAEINKVRVQRGGPFLWRAELFYKIIGQGGVEKVEEVSRRRWWSKRESMIVLKRSKQDVETAIKRAGGLIAVLRAPGIIDDISKALQEVAFRLRRTKYLRKLTVTRPSVNKLGNTTTVTLTADLHVNGRVLRLKPGTQRVELVGYATLKELLEDAAKATKLRLQGDTKIHVSMIGNTEFKLGYSTKIKESAMLTVNAQEVDVATKTSSTAKKVSDEILKQLGGNKFIAMTGAKDFSYGTEKGGDYLSMRLPSKGRKPNTVKIVYDRAKDLYALEFYKINAKKAQVKLLHRANGVDAEGMRSVFTDKTGLLLSLAGVGA